METQTKENLQIGPDGRLRLTSTGNCVTNCHKAHTCYGVHLLYNLFPLILLSLSSCQVPPSPTHLGPDLSTS